MSFGSGHTTNLPQPEPKPLGLEPSRLSTDQQARPLPLVVGVGRIGVTFITPPFNQIIEEVKQSGGMSGEDITLGYNYRCSWAAVICHGPLDRLDKIFFDDVEVWPKGGAGLTRDTTVDKVVAFDIVSRGSNYTSTPTVSIDPPPSGTPATARALVRNGKLVGIEPVSLGSGYVTPPAITISGGGGLGASVTAILGSETYRTIAIPGFGANYRIYWGTEHQYFDPTLALLSEDAARNPNGVDPANAAAEHPAYSGQAYLVASRHFIGYNKQNLQNIECVVARYPKFAAVAAPEVNDDANLASVLLEAWSNQRYGFGLSTAYADASFTAVADTLTNEGLGVSPVVTRQTPFKDFLASALQNVDAFLTVLGSGQVGLGLVRELPYTGSPPALPVIDESCLIEPPDWDELDGYDATFSAVHVAFTNRDHGFKDDSVPGIDLANFTITGEAASQTLRLPWITRPDMAWIVANNAAKIMSQPRLSGRLKVRKSKRQGLTVGNLFKLSYQHEGLCWLYCRVLAVTVPNPFRPVIEIEFENDRGSFAEKTYSAPPYVAPAKPVAPAPDFVYQTVLEAPYIPENTGQRPYLIALAARPSKLCVGARIQIAGTTDSPKQINAFVRRGHVVGDFTHQSDGRFTFIVDSIDTDVPTSLTSNDADQDTFLAIVGAAPNDEWMALYNVTPDDPAAHRYSADVKRERFDSKRLTHADGTEVWLVSKADLLKNAFRLERATYAGASYNFEFLPQYPDVEYTGTPASVGVTFTDRIKRFWKPRGLTVNGTTWYGAPSWGGNGATRAVTWTPVSREGDNAARKWAGVTQHLWHLEVRKMDGSLVGTAMRYSADTASAQLTIDLTGETQFKLRIYARQVVEGVGLESRTYDEAVVNLA